LAISITPVPVGTEATMLPLGAKLGVSLSMIRLRKMRVELPPWTGQVGQVEHQDAAGVAGGDVVEDVGVAAVLDLDAGDVELRRGCA
jgi:hypothetical protein